MKKLFQRMTAAALALMLFMSPGYGGRMSEGGTGGIMTASAATQYSGKCGKNLKWSYNKSKKLLTISGTGAMYSYECGEREMPWLGLQPKTVEIQDGVTSIGYEAFSGLESIRTVKLGKSVSKIGDWAFFDAGLEAYEVSPDNKSFASKDGVLFNKSMTKMLAYPENKKDKEYKLPDTVTAIANGAISENEAAIACVEYLEKILFPAGFTTLGKRNFNWMGITLCFQGKQPKGFDQCFEGFGGKVIVPKGDKSWTLYGKQFGEDDYQSDITWSDSWKSAPAVNTPTLSNQKGAKMKVAWTASGKNTAASGYQVQYSTSQKFTGAKSVTVKSTASSGSQIISKLTKGKTYYVRVRSYHKFSTLSAYSGWSETAKVKITK